VTIAVRFVIGAAGGAMPKNALRELAASRNSCTSPFWIVSRRSAAFAIVRRVWSAPPSHMRIVS
jgi:hypothetical protein